MDHKTIQASFEVKQVSDEGIIEGYGNVFDVKDHALDITMKGAFTKSLQSIKSNGKTLPLLYQHKADEPIGVFTELSEDQHGLKVKAQINLDTQKGREVLSLIKQKAISGLSIGYRTIREEWDSKQKANLLHELEVHEISAVTFPCNEASRIDRVKSLLEHSCLPTQPELEKALKETGFTNSQAKMVVAKYRPNHKDITDFSQDELKAHISDCQDLLTVDEVDMTELKALFA